MDRRRRPADAWSRATPARRFGGVSIDTRTLAPGDLFVAIRGERFDGARVRRRGARRAARRASWSTAARGAGRGRTAGRGAARHRGRRHDARRCRTLARAVRRASGAKVVAITGSAGQDDDEGNDGGVSRGAVPRCSGTRGNLNNHIGLPLSLLELSARPDMAVVELGMNHAGEIRTLVGIAEPDVRVWTNVGDAHLGFFASRRRDRRREGGDPRRRAPRRRCSSPTPTTPRIARASPAFRGPRRDVRHRSAGATSAPVRVERSRPRRHGARP